MNEIIHDYYLKNHSKIKSLDDLGNEIDSIFKEISNQKIVPVTDFYPTKRDVEKFPENTWLLHIKFKLKKPCHSRDERISECNNPILRDRLLGCPMVAPSTWKGNLRFASGKVEGDNKEIINRLFGPESDNDESARKGRLYFYPTFLIGKVEKDVITPLSRETRTPVKGKAPISMEVVPAGETGDFYLLYFPYPKDKDWKPKEIKEDMEFIARAMEIMFLEYGFSAKKTSGFGVIHKTFEDFSLCWDGKNKENNIISGKVKNFEQLHEETAKIGVAK